MNPIWYFLIGGLLVFISLVVGIFIGAGLTDSSDYIDDDDYDYKEEYDVDFIQRCLHDDNVQNFLSTYDSGILKLDKDNLNNLILRLVSDYIIVEIELTKLKDSNYMFFSIDEDDYSKYYNRLSIEVEKTV